MVDVSCFVRFHKDTLTQKSVLNMASSDSQVGKPEHGRPKRAELLDVNINTVGTQSNNTEGVSLMNSHK